MYWKKIIDLTPIKKTSYRKARNPESEIKKKKSRAVDEKPKWKWGSTWKLSNPARRVVGEREFLFQTPRISGILCVWRSWGSATQRKANPRRNKRHKYTHTLSLSLWLWGLGKSERSFWCLTCSIFRLYPCSSLFLFCFFPLFVAVSIQLPGCHVFFLLFFFSFKNLEF